MKKIFILLFLFIIQTFIFASVIYFTAPVNKTINYTSYPNGVKTKNTVEITTNDIFAVNIDDNSFKQSGDCISIYSDVYDKKNFSAKKISDTKVGIYFSGRGFKWDDKYDVLIPSFSNLYTIEVSQSEGNITLSDVGLFLGKDPACDSAFSYYQPVLSPDNSKLAFLKVRNRDNHQELWSYDFSSNLFTTEIAEDKIAIYSFQWLKIDNKLDIFMDTNYGLLLYDKASEEVKTFTSFSNNISNPYVSPDHSKILLLLNQRELVIADIDFNNFTISNPVTITTMAVKDYAFLSDNNHIAVIAYYKSGFKILIFDITDPQKISYNVIDTNDYEPEKLFCLQ